MLKAAAVYRKIRQFQVKSASYRSLCMAFFD